MSPKDRVKANIYKNLLQEEKAKNKRYGKMSASLFLVGILGTTGYFNMIKENIFNNSRNSIMVFDKTAEIAENKKVKIEIDHFFSKELFKNREIEVNTQQVFGFDFQS
ncbi:MAG: hypothetical protein ACRC0V_08685 [Fusobacteriaceae bacterium]